MHKITWLSIAALASLVGAAIAQAPEPEPAWRKSALALVPAGYVGGDAYRTDEAAMTGYLAVYPANANDPKSPGSVFAPRQVLVVKLAKSDGALRASSAELQPRIDPTRGNRDTTMTDPDGEERQFDETGRRTRSRPRETPRGYRALQSRRLVLGSRSQGPERARRTLGQGARARHAAAALPAEDGRQRKHARGGWLTEFRIIGFKDGWFLIEGATPPGKEYEDEKKYPRHAPKPYAGRGWVAANKVGANYANGGTRMGGLFQAPFVDAQWMPAQRKLGGTLDTDGGPKRILACSGHWGLVESHDGVRGWWRSLCSSQVTNCS